MQNVAVQDPAVNASVELAEEDSSPLLTAPPLARDLPLPAAPRTMPMFGPVGRRRSPWAIAALAFVTLGVASLGWYRRVNREMEEFDPQLHTRTGRSVVAVVIPWLAGLLTALAGAALIVVARIGLTLPAGIHLADPWPYVLLGGLLAIPWLEAVIPFSLVSIVMTIERLRCVEEHAGVSIERQVRPVKVSLLLFVPVIGGLVLLARMQSRLNAIWETLAPSGHVSR
ncbi:MAG: hypothetical protein ACYDAC_09345 [Candidatus Dormibacteria bacterium]